MTKSLPVEIIRKVFSNLENEDLQDCRLVCKQWYGVALEKLRETLSFTHFTEETAVDLIQTLKNSPDIAGQVKYLDIDIQKPLDDDEPFDENYVMIYWDIEDLLKIVFEYCPNITTVTCSTNPIFEMWEIMLKAINQGHLKYLELIPKADEMDMAFYYLPVALALKSRLKRMHICNGFLAQKVVNDQVFNPSQKNGPFSDPWLEKFSHLEYLSFYWFGNESLLNCDTMINNCTRNNAHLKSLYLLIKPLQDPQLPKVTLDFIHACYNIKEFKCSWQMLDDDDIIYYLIQKFPNLDHLTVELGPYVWRLENVSSQALYTLFEYMSKISKLDITCHVQTVQVETCLLSLMTKHNDLEIELVFDPKGVYEYDTLTITRSAKNGTHVIVTTTSNPLYIDKTSHLEWLKGEISGRIETLTVTHLKKPNENQDDDREIIQ